MSHPFQSGELRVVSRKRLTDQTAAALREYILVNKLAPGTRLPAETSLAGSLGVSRNVLRQAVSSLEGLGMLRVTQGSGTYVADLADTEVFQQIAAWMGSATLSEEDYLEVRAIWERGIFQLVMDRAQPADLDRLDEIAAAMVETDDPQEATAQHEKFHEALLHVTGNQFLVTIGTIMHRFFWEFGYRDAIVRKPPEPRVLTSHRSIVALLRTGKPKNIQHMIELHLWPHLSSDDEVPAEVLGVRAPRSRRR
ncbi:MAG TPA: GntR family transcriptional regulator [Mycobacteriales bacterium]|jgi:GntR family transcriptional repressor for pyruvate dehydrogenase complex|nr:GntR family transcriptional regulator [Mycobacteriales bacterium]